MIKKEKEMQENKAIIDLTLEEALMCLSRTLYDRNVDMRVIMARQDLIGVITRKTQYLQDLLEIVRKALVRAGYIRIYDFKVENLELGELVMLQTYLDKKVEI